MAIEQQIFPIVEDLGMADEHEIQWPTDATVNGEPGAVISLSGFLGLLTKQVAPGDHATLRFGVAFRKLLVNFAGDGNVAAGELIGYDRATATAGKNYVAGSAAGVVEVLALPRIDPMRNVDDANAAAATTDPTIIVALLPFEYTPQADTDYHVPFEGDFTLNP